MSIIEFTYYAMAHLNPAVFMFSFISIGAAIYVFVIKFKPQHAHLSFQIISLVTTNLCILSVVLKLAHNIGKISRFVVFIKQANHAILFSKVIVLCPMFAMGLCVIFATITIYKLNADFHRYATNAIYIASAFGIIFAGNVVGVLFYLEILSVVTMAMLLTDKNVPTKVAITYILIHILSGTLMLCGVAMLGTYDADALKEIVSSNFVEQPVMRDSLSKMMKIGLCVSCGAPPFVYVITGIYGLITGSNRALIAGVSTKIALFVLMSFFDSSQIVGYIGVVMVLYTATYATLEKSLAKSILLTSAMHVGIILSCMIYGKNMEFLPLFTMVQMVCIFCVMLCVDCCVKVNDTEIDDIALLSAIRGKMKKIEFAPIVLGFLLFLGFPLMPTYMAEKMLHNEIEANLTLKILFQISEAVGLFVGVRIIMGFFGNIGVMGKMGNITKNCLNDFIVKAQTQPDFRTTNKTTSIYILLFIIIVSTTFLIQPFSDISNIDADLLTMQYSPYSIATFLLKFIFAILTMSYIMPYMLAGISTVPDSIIIWDKILSPFGLYLWSKRQPVIAIIEKITASKNSITDTISDQASKIRFQTFSSSASSSHTLILSAVMIIAVLAICIIA